MTKEEMKEMIATKIKGQGNQVDLSGAVAEVLDSLVDAMGGEEIIEVTTDMFFSPITEEFRDKLYKASIIKYGGEFLPRIGKLDTRLSTSILGSLESGESYDSICFANGYEEGDFIYALTCIYVVRNGEGTPILYEMDV